MELLDHKHDLNYLEVIHNGNSLKMTGEIRDGRVLFSPPTTADEHIVVQRDSKAQELPCFSLFPDDHVAVFHYMDDARGIYGMQFKLDSKSALNQLKANPEDMKILIIVQTILIYLHCSINTPKTGSHRSGNVLKMFFNPLLLIMIQNNNWLIRFLSEEKMDLEEMDLKWQMAMLSIRVHKFEQKARRKIDFDKKESARFNKTKVRCYKCFQRGHFARECRSKGGNDKQRYSSFKIQEIGKKEEDSKALITVDTLVDWTEHDGQSDGVIAP
ncbi:ribonuclease H-like domain-containing protein [Tanacetum coccineum]